ncbi:uncharacterized protein VTP21DRAFT_4575 [Calcarisporiella thermophila]|uniref:uncharacterized protein n=1 Tax=Calcarisporiella thermophila TaxID=911321 RepID=UPI003742DA67
METSKPIEPPLSVDLPHREGLTTETHDWTMVRAGDIVRDQKVVVIDGDQPVEEACDVLVKHGILSAPVYDKNSKSYVGMFDYGDVIAYLLLLLHRQEAPDQSLEVKELIQHALKSQPVPVKLASDLSRKNPFYSVFPETPLLQVIEEFSSGTHRVAVMDGNGDIKGILSQSAVVAYLYKNVSKFPDLSSYMNKSIHDLSLGKAPVVSVQTDQLVLNALSIMSEHGISSLAVVDPSGVLLSAITMTDVKYVMKSHHHSLLWSTCFQFISHVRSLQGLENGQDAYPVFDIRPESTLGFAIAKLVATRAHRLWVTEPRGQVIGVVSLTDISRVFAKSAGLTVPTGRTSGSGTGLRERKGSLAKGSSLGLVGM